VDTTRINKKFLSESQYRAVKHLHGQLFLHGWQLHQALRKEESSWQLDESANRLEKMRLEQKLEMVIRESTRNQSVD
jgi:predicted Holliday junction resolvase-like endonuclease